MDVTLFRSKTKIFFETMVLIHLKLFRCEIYDFQLRLLSIDETLPRYEIVVSYRSQNYLDEKQKKQVQRQNNELLSIIFTFSKRSK